MLVLVGTLLKNLHHVVLISIKEEKISSLFLSNFAEEVMTINNQSCLFCSHLNIWLKVILLPQTLKLLFVLFY
jgi:hypothetical protein